IDVSRPDQLRELNDWVLRNYGHVHLLCNNAGVDGYRGGAIWDATDADWEWTFGVNFWGAVNGIRAFLPDMIAHGETGNVINTASVAALVKANNMYCITKHAVLALTETVHEQLMSRGSRIGATVFIPGPVATQLFARRHRPDVWRDGADVDIACGSQERQQ